MRSTTQSGERQATQSIPNEVTELLALRRNTAMDDTTERRRLNKKIRSTIRTQVRAKRCAEINHILADYRNLNKISGIKSQRKDVMISCMADSSGNAQYDRQGIAD
eukprot:9353937-Pyramimonas_sp.AAC.1